MIIKGVHSEKENKNMHENVKELLCLTSIIFSCTMQEIGGLALEVSLNKPAYMSTQYKNRVPGQAVDGVWCEVTTNSACDICITTTNSQANPWWKVDLTQIFTIRYVIIQTSGMCRMRLNCWAQLDFSHRVNVLVFDGKEHSTTGYAT